MSKDKTQKKLPKLPRINCSFKVFGSCEEDYVIWGKKLADISKLRGIPKSTLTRWKTDYEWDEQRSAYGYRRGQLIRIVAKLTQKCLVDNPDPKDLQLLKDFNKQLIDTDPNLRMPPNSERVKIVKMTIDSMKIKHAKMVNRYLKESEYKQLVEDVVNF